MTREGGAPLSLARRIARLDQIIARYERRGWTIGTRLDARAEIAGRGTRRRYLEVGADGTLTDRAMEEPAAHAPRRPDRSLARGGGVVLLVILIVCVIPLALSFNGSGSSGALDVTAGSDAAAAPTEEQFLAAAQQGTAAPDDPLVQSFANELDSLEQSCSESRSALGDFALDAGRRLAAVGISEPLLDTVDEMRRAVIDRGASRDSCRARLLADLEQRAGNVAAP